MIGPVKGVVYRGNRQSGMASAAESARRMEPALTGHFAGQEAHRTSQWREDRTQESGHLFSRHQNDQFEREVMRHLDAAFNLALWLLTNPQDAEDATQSALFKAFRAYGRMRGSDARPWLLAIVRNECMDVLNHRTSKSKTETLHDEDFEFIEARGPSPEESALAALDSESVLRAIHQLPPEFREVILLREIEEMSYLEIAQVIEKPIGTVMSRLARGRDRLQILLTKESML